MEKANLLPLSAHLTQKNSNITDHRTIQFDVEIIFEMKILSRGFRQPNDKSLLIGTRNVSSRLSVDRSSEMRHFDRLPIKLLFEPNFG